MLLYDYAILWFQLFHRLQTGALCFTILHPMLFSSGQRGLLLLRFSPEYLILMVCNFRSQLLKLNGYGTLLLKIQFRLWKFECYKKTCPLPMDGICLFEYIRSNLDNISPQTSFVNYITYLLFSKCNKLK